MHITCRQELENLFSSLEIPESSIQVNASSQNQSQQSHAHGKHLSLKALPILSTIKDLSGPIPYIKIREEVVISPAFPNEFRIGLAWQAGESRDESAHCGLDPKIPLHALLPVLTHSDFRLFALDARAFHEAIPQGIDAIMQLPSPLNQDQNCLPSSLPSAIAAMDVIIGADSIVTRMAAAMGRRTLILLQHAPDWPFSGINERSPWFPSARLYRQIRPGDWSVPIQQLADDLAASRYAFENSTWQRLSPQDQPQDASIEEQALVEPQDASIEEQALFEPQDASIEEQALFEPQDASIEEQALFEPQGRFHRGASPF